MDICDNKPFDQSEESFAKLEELLKVSLSVFEITLLPGYDDNSKDKYDLFTNSQIYKPNSSGLVHQGLERFQTSHLSSE